MAIPLADRVRETTTTTGTGAVSLAGAVAGYRSFVDSVGNNGYCLYCIQGGSEWEVGLGTITDGSPDTLTRQTVFSSSNSNALVNFSSGEKDVFLTYAADYHDCDVFLAGEALAIRDAVFLITGGGAGDGGRVYKCKADDVGMSTAAEFVGFVMFAVSDGERVLVRRSGTMAGFSGLSAGSQYYLSAATAGAITTTAPSNARLVALGTTTTSLYIIPKPEAIYFTPAYLPFAIFGGGSVATSSSASQKRDDIYTIDGRLRSGHASDKGSLTVARSGLAGFYTEGPDRLSAFGGGYSSAVSNILESVSRETLVANGSDFGDLTVARASLAGSGGGADESETFFMLFAGGQTAAGVSSQIDQVDATGAPGNATDHGDLTLARRALAGTSTISLLSIFAGGFASSLINVIDIAVAQSAGDASDKGEMLVARYGLAGLGSYFNDNAFFCGGATGKYESLIEIIDGTTTVEVASDVGELIVARALMGSIGMASDLGYLAGGVRGGELNLIEVLDLTTSYGSAGDKGDMPASRSEMAGA